LAQVLHAAATGGLDRLPPLAWDPGAAVTVVVAAEHYPDTPRTGDPIEGIARAEEVPGVHVLQAGTRRDDDGVLRSAGGRVLSVTAVGHDLESARSHAYEGVARISLAGSHYRRDIAARAVASPPH
jgi:phosphoribosylamine--glycine ligase